MRVLERIFSVTVFPLVFGASLVWAAQVLRSGGSQAVALGVPAVASALLILVLERVFPHQRSWLRSRGDVPVDLSHLVSVSLTTMAMSALAYLLALPVVVWLSDEVGLAFWPLLWPREWPWPAQLVLALVVAELPKYGWHRLEHEVELFWRLHATHHSAPRLYWLNAVRFHPVDIAVDTLVGLFPLWVLGCGEEILVLFAIASTVHGYFQHANLKLRLGPLNYFFSMAELHRWHHSKTLAEANTNYGQNVIVWDLVFGTRFLPADREPPEAIGIAGLPAFPMTYWRQLASPFQWRRIRAGSA